jgi:DNA replication protein DnaC
MESLDKILEILQKQRKNQSFQIGESKNEDFKALEARAKKEQAVFRQLINTIHTEYKVEAVEGWIIDELALYFFQNPYFERASSPIKNPSLKKGLLFSGNVGTGKSFTLFLLSQITQNFNPWKGEKFGLFTCRQIVRQYKKNQEIIERHGSGSYKTFSDYTKTPITKAFDGFGEEIKQGIVIHYGNRVNVMEEIFLDRYDEYLKTGMKTHTTTNLTLPEIEERYSTMLADRFKQMFNNIPFLGPSKRK